MHTNTHLTQSNEKHSTVHNPRHLIKRLIRIFSSNMFILLQTTIFSMLNPTAIIIQAFLMALFLLPCLATCTPFMHMVYNRQNSNYLQSPIRTHSHGAVSQLFWTSPLQNLISLLNNPPHNISTFEAQSCCSYQDTLWTVDSHTHTQACTHTHTHTHTHTQGLIVTLDPTKPAVQYYMNAVHFW